MSGYGETLAKASWNDFLPDASRVCQDRCGCVCTTFIAPSISSESPSHCYGTVIK